MKILLTGSDGQLGHELQCSLPEKYSLIAVDREQLDITNSQQVMDFFAQNTPDWVINAAAYTAVDKAEVEHELAWSVNHKGAENLALAAKEHKAHLLQVSTDFVFSDKQASPYLTDDNTGPTSVYGASKDAGDKSVLSILNNQALIVRTSWLYSSHGNNFVKTMLQLMQERDTLGLVADQIGTPTWAATLANCIWKLIEARASGLYHCADNGVASWYDFAVAIQEESLQCGLLTNQALLKPIRTEDYPTPAIRPVYSIMDKTKIEKKLQIVLPHWRTSLRNMLNEL